MDLSGESDPDPSLRARAAPTFEGRWRAFHKKNQNDPENEEAQCVG